MKTEDILKLTSAEVDKLTLKELRTITQQLTHVEQVRINRLEKAGLDTPAVQSFKKIADTLGTRGKTLNEVRNTFAKVKYQMGLKTSTIKGAKSVASELSKRLGGNASEIDINSFWKVYNKYQEAYGVNFKFTGESEKVQKILYSISKEYAYFDESFLLEELDRRLQEIYEEIEDDTDEFDF